MGALDWDLLRLGCYSGVVGAPSRFCLYHTGDNEVDVFTFGDLQARRLDKSRLHSAPHFTVNSVEEGGGGELSCRERARTQEANEETIQGPESERKPYCL